MKYKRGEVISFPVENTITRKDPSKGKMLQQKRTERWVDSQLHRQQVRNKRAKELQAQKDNQAALQIREKVRKQLQEPNRKPIVEAKTVGDIISHPVQDAGTTGSAQQYFHDLPSDLLDIDPFNRGGKSRGERYWGCLLNSPQKPKRSLLDKPIPPTPPTPFFKPLIPQPATKPTIEPVTKPTNATIPNPLLTPLTPSSKTNTTAISNINTAPYSIDADLAARSHSYHYPYPYPGNENENDLAEIENETPDETESIIPRPWLDPFIKPRYIRRFLTHTSPQVSERVTDYLRRE